MAFTEEPRIPSSDFGSAVPYIPMEADYYIKAPNCYAYALGLPYNMQPGEKSNSQPQNVNNVQEVLTSVINDLDVLDYSYRPISGPNEKI